MTRTTIKRLFARCSLAVTIILTTILLVPAPAVSSRFVAEVWTDQENYVPGDIVQIFGSGWAPGIGLPPPPGSMDRRA